MPTTSSESPCGRSVRLLDKDTNTVHANIASATGMPSGLIQDAYPCSPLQIGLMALSNKVPAIYIARHTLELPSTLSVDRVQGALGANRCQQRCARTRIVDTDEYGTVQVV